MKERKVRSKQKLSYQYCFSVIVLTYKTDYETVKRTIDSIILQKFCNFELIVSEDGSESQWMKPIERYLKEKGFNNYKLRNNEVNYGTVRNYYEALKIAEGRFVKVLGAGDCLYDDTALKKIYEFMVERSCCLGFGRMQAYRMVDGKLKELGEYKAPIRIGLYSHKLWKLLSMVNTLVLHDWISGASMFGTKKAIMHYLRMVIGKAKYTEDIYQIFVFAEKRHLEFLNQNIVYYEYGDGISTKKNNKKKLNMLRVGVDKSIEYALVKYKNNKLYYYLLKLGYIKNDMGRKFVEYILDLMVQQRGM